MLKVARLTDTAVLPTRANADDVGLDLYADEDQLLMAGCRRLISTGIKVAIPKGFVGSVRPRSGLAVTHGVTVLNAPGTINPGDRGEVKVLLVNHGSHHFEVKQGTRVAQLVLELCADLHVYEVDELPDGSRGEDGFGSSGA